MDIHPPHGSIRSWKDFALQLVTIAAGVLIALSFEGVREWNHNRTLVDEAREVLRREIADNKKEVDDEIAEIAERNKKIDTAIRFATDLLKTKRTEINHIELGFSFPTLNTAGWQTADRTGALSHMDYTEVQKFAAVYNMQDYLVQQHRRAIDAVTAALGILSADGEDPTKAPPAELERFRQQVVALRSILFVEEQMARRASEVYKKALE